MSPEEKDLIKSTWSQVMPIAETAAALFYERLFQLDPSLQALFAGADMAGQRKKLMQAIATVVGAIDDLEAVVPAVRDLGRRHVGYGVTEAHFETVGAALLWTLEQGLGPAWNPAVKAAWANAYGAIADVMQAAMAETDAAAA